MFYILIGFPSAPFKGYQESYKGDVIRTTDLDGNTIVLNDSSFVVDANPPQPTWAIPDPIESTPTPSKLLSRLQFRNTFTAAEKIAIYTAAQSNIQIKIWLDDLAVTDMVDLADPQTISSLTELESYGIIAAGRASQILAS
jgi:hypothetical protein